MNLFGAYAFFAILSGVSLTLLIIPGPTLSVTVRESIIAIIGDQMLKEAELAMASARQRSDVTPLQKQLLQIFGILAGVPIVLILLFFVDWRYALSLGSLVSLVGGLWPAAVWKGGVTKRLANAVYRDVPDLVSFLRLNVGEGRSLKEVIDAYVADSRSDNLLAGEIRQVLRLAEGGANLFDQFERTAARFPFNDLLQCAIALRQVEEAEEPQVVLQSLYELIRAVRIAERKKEIKARVLFSIVLGVVFLMPALFALILVPALVTFNNLWGN
jgi:hypothetical protein